MKSSKLASVGVLVFSSAVILFYGLRFLQNQSFQKKPILNIPASPKEQISPAVILKIRLISNIRILKILLIFQKRVSIVKPTLNIQSFQRVFRLKIPHFLQMQILNMLSFQIQLI